MWARGFCRDSRGGFSRSRLDADIPALRIGPKKTSIGLRGLKVIMLIMFAHTLNDRLCYPDVGWSRSRVRQESAWLNVRREGVWLGGL